MSEAENEARKFYREIDMSNLSEEEKAEFRDEVHEVYGVPYQNTEHGEGSRAPRPPSEYETGVGRQSMSQPCGQRSSAASESDAAVIDGGDTRVSFRPHYHTSSRSLADRLNPNPASRVQSWLKKLDAADQSTVWGGHRQTEGTEEPEGSHCEFSDEGFLTRVFLGRANPSGLYCARSQAQRQ